MRREHLDMVVVMDGAMLHSASSHHRSIRALPWL
jgi:hypothetical protein